MKRFSDFAKEDIVLDGEKIRIEDVLNKEIVVLNYRICNSQYKKNKSGKYLSLQIELDDNKYILFTGSDVLMRQADQYKNEMPFMAKITKIDRYYTFT